MLPICSATTYCSSHYQMSYCAGLRIFSPSQKVIEVRCVVEDRVVFFMPNGIHPQQISFKTRATNHLYSYATARPELSGSLNFTSGRSYPSEFGDIEHRLSNNWSCSMGKLHAPYAIGRENLKYVDNSSLSTSGGQSLDLPDPFTQSKYILSGPSVPETTYEIDAPTEIVLGSSNPGSNSLDVVNDSLSKLKTNFEDFLSSVSESVDNSFDKGESAVQNSLDTITFSVKNTFRSAVAAVENAVGNVFSTVDQTGDLAGNKLEGLSGDLKEATNKVGVIAIDALRQAIVSLENYFATGISFVVYSYGSGKELLPADVRGVLNLYEQKVTDIISPVGIAFRQVYIGIEALEKNLGLDPSDPIIPFALLLGTSATLGISYWVLTYGGYSGDLSPKLTLELLTGEENVVLIDVRPEDLRERDGVPDLRRRARFKYGSVSVPEIDGPVRKLLKGGKDLDDALIAAVIRNLKIVQDRSKVIVMDADGAQSKSIARFLRKLGVERAYLVQGGFRAWVSNGLRVKELKPETALTVLNEEAEAILEDIRPTPVQLIGYGMGFIAASYAFLEWETTLQLIGLVGLGQTIYRRVAAYEGSDDFKQDLRLLLAPVKLGAEAFSWAAGKLEPNRIGLPTSPSSTAVKNRVLQAAAKHESQPSDTEEIRDPSRESTVPVNENVDLSEA